MVLNLKGPLTMLTTTSLTALQRRTDAELSSTRSFLSVPGRRLDLREIVNAQMQYPVKPVDERSIQTAHEASELLRQRSGHAPNGLFFPLAALTRDLTLSANPGAVAASVANSAGSALLPASAVMNAGATVLTGLEGSSLHMPVVSQSFDPSDAWVGEGDSGEGKTLEFEQSQMAPRQIIVVVRVSRRLLANSAVDVDALLRREIADRFSMAIDRAAMVGTGPDQPEGLLNNAGLTVLSAGDNGAAPIWEHLLDIEHAVLASGRSDLRAPGFFLSPALARRMRRSPRVVGGEQFILEGRELLGYPIRISTSMPDDLDKGTSVGVCSGLVFGDVAEMTVGFWGPAAVDILVDSVTQAKDGFVRVIARADVGVAPRRIGCFAAYKDLLSV